MGGAPPKDAEFPCVTLHRDDWDDFGVKILFNVRFWKSKNSKSIKLGQVKILSRDKKGIVGGDTSLPKEFTTLLPQFYCSLGQERRYYEILRDLEEGIEILENLQDIVIKPSQADPFEDEWIFKEGLIRFSEAEENYGTAHEIFGLQQPHEEYIRKYRIGEGFTFKYRFKGFSAPHEVECHFKSSIEKLPYRIMAFVGKNGTGKTAVLSAMARLISGVSKDDKPKRDVFTPSRPPFSRVIAISYSPFGPFKYPLFQTSSYRFCGLLNEDGLPDFAILEKRVKQNIKQILSLKIERHWFKALETAGLFKNEPVMGKLRQPSSPAVKLRLLKRLSSGHYYITLFLTDIVANLTKNSLLIIDEPELYLHPNMVSATMRAVEDLLGSFTFNSYAIVATHSPIIIQEILGQNVRNFLKIEGRPICRTLDFESFGENLTTLINKVFGQTLEDKNYMRILDELCRNRNVEAVNALFDNKLGMNALSYVDTVIRQLREEKE